MAGLISKLEKRDIIWVLFQDDTDCATGNGKDGAPVAADMDGLNLIDVLVCVDAKGVTGTMDVQIRREREGTSADMLSTKVTVGNEFFTNDGVIDTAKDDLVKGDMIYVDVDAVHSGTAAKGLSVIGSFR